MSKHTTHEWVCTDCFLTIAGYDEHELGHETPTPYADDTSVCDVTNGTDPTACEYCIAEFGPDADPTDIARYDLHSEHDTDNAMLAECDSCGRFGGECHQGHAVTVERREMS